MTQLRYSSRRKEISRSLIRGLNSQFSILASLSIDKLDWTPKQRAITSVCFVPYADARHLLLLGNSTGHLTLAELGSYSSQILLQSRPHGDGVTSIRLLHSGKSLHRIETLSRDGVKSQVDLSFETGEWRMVVRHRIKLTKGVLEAVSKSHTPRWLSGLFLASVAMSNPGS